MTIDETFVTAATVSNPDVYTGCAAPADTLGTHYTLSTCPQLVPQKRPESALPLPFCSLDDGRLRLSVSCLFCLSEI